MAYAAQIKNNIVVFTEIGNSDDTYTMPFGQFLNMVQTLGEKVYIHSLASNGASITPYLLNNGFSCVGGNVKLEANQFSKIQNEGGDILSIRIKATHRKKANCYFYDAKKILMTSVSSLRSSFDFEGNDVQVVAQCLDFLFKEGHTSNSMGANAWNYFLKTQFPTEDGKIDRRKTNIFFPQITIEEDDFIRKSYKGGWCYLSPKHAEMPKSGVTLDVNSLFPHVMLTCKLPVGKPKPFTGEYQFDRNYPLFIQEVEFDWMALKEGKVPCATDKSLFDFQDEYTETAYNKVKMTITNVELELLKETYHYGKITYGKGLKFATKANLFDKYINEFAEIKKTSTGAKRQLAKLMMNSLYGKFGSKVKRMGFTYAIDEKTGIETRKATGIEVGYMYYTAMSSFITAYARAITVRAANINFNNFIYADTDSLHLACSLDEVKGLVIDNYEIGAWKVEKEFTDSKFITLKCYAEKDESGWEFIVAGLPLEASSQLNINNFHLGAEVECVSRVKVKGGSEIKKQIFRIGAKLIGRINIKQNKGEM